MASVCYGAETSGKRTASLVSISSSAPDVKIKLKTRSRTSIPIEIAFDSLDLDDVASHFSVKNDEDAIVDIEPYVLCRDVTVHQFNSYFVGGNIRSDLINVDWPSTTHESATDGF